MSLGTSRNLAWRSVTATVNLENVNIHSRFTPFAITNSDYRGELKVLLANLGTAPFAIARGERIAQLVVSRVAQAGLIEVETLTATPRGAGGFGSTGTTNPGTVSPGTANPGTANPGTANPPPQRPRPRMRSRT